nr:juvenile hormone esterase-like [Cherax quadricarinatus]
MKVLATIVLALSAAVVALQEAPFVMTEGGMISGLIQRSTRSRTFYSYYNIPFAKPPLGHLRFKDPVSPEPWVGVKDGSKMPKSCLQVPFGPANQGIKVTSSELLGSEDCLYLNVLLQRSILERQSGDSQGQSRAVVLRQKLRVLKDKDSEPELPVMVWIHGGAFFSGGAFEYMPRCSSYQKQLIVFLKPIGIAKRKPGTVAELSLLSYFHSNAKGLFSRVIMQSGSALSPWATGWKFRETAEEIGQTMGCPVSQDSQALIDCLQKVDGHKLTVVVQDYFQWHILPLIFGPRVDGDFIPDDPAKLVLEGRYHKVDLMAGVTGDEGAFATHAMFANRNLINDLKANFTTTGPASIQLMEAVDGEDVVEMARRVYFYYLGKGLNIDEDHSEALTQLYSDIHFMVDYDLVTQYYAHHAHHRNTYRYEFQYRGELSFGDLFDTNVGKHCKYECMKLSQLANKNHDYLAGYGLG